MSAAVQQSVLAFVLFLSALTGQDPDIIAKQITGAISSSGGGGVYETSYLVAADNGITPDFNNTGLTNIPAHWGPTSLAVQIGDAPPNGAALRGRTYLNNRTGYISRFELYVASSAMAVDGFVSIAVAKAISPLSFDDAAVPIVYYVRMTNVAGALKLQISFPTITGEQAFVWSGVVALNTVNTLYIEHSIVYGRTVFRVNNDTVVSFTHDAAVVPSIGTLVLGSSAGSTGRDVTYLIDRILETPLPSGARLPSNVSVEFPANAATNIEVSATLVCTVGADVDTREIRYETVNPPVGAWTSLGTGRELGPLSLANNTPYYVQCRGSNENGTGPTSAVSSFTTIAATSTGTHPTLLINATRQATWAQMKADYDASGNPKCATYTGNQEIGCHLYKTAITIQAGDTGLIYSGLWSAWLANVPGNNAATYCDQAYNQTTAFRTSDAITKDLNSIREHLTEWTIIYDWCYQSWSQTRRDTYLTRLNWIHTYAASVAPFRCADVDQPIGQYFGLAAFYFSTSAYNPTVVNLWADPDFGGLTAHTLNCFATAATGFRDARDMIKSYYEVQSAGGAFLEGTEYGLGTPHLGIWGCEAVRTTAAGNAPCAEIDAWIDDHAQWLTAFITPDALQAAQNGDDENPRNIIGRLPYGGIYPMLSLTGLLPDGAIRQQLWRQVLNIRAARGLAPVTPSRAVGVFLANPYITAAADLTGVPKSHYSSGYGVQIWNDGRDAGDCQFWAHIPNAEALLGIEHWVGYFGDFQLYCGEWVLTHPIGYGSSSNVARGVNATVVEGLSAFPTPAFQTGTSRQFRGPVGRTEGSDYLYFEGTQGGMVHPSTTIGGTGNFFNPPPRFVHEHSRGFMGLPSATEDYFSVLVWDRINALDPETLTPFTSYPNTGTWGASADQALIKSHPRFTTYLHQLTDPTVSANVTTWATPSGNWLLRDVWVSPDAVTITEQLEKPLEATGEYTTSSVPGAYEDTELAYRTKVEPVTNVQWNCLSRVITARKSGATVETVTELTPTNNAAGVHLARTGNKDRVAVWNCGQGPDITQTRPTQAQAAAVLQVARYFGAGAYTVTYTQGTATADVLIAHLNPALTWAYTLDGGASIPITEDAGGFEALSISGTGAHTLVITGS